MKDFLFSFVFLPFVFLFFMAIIAETAPNWGKPRVKQWTRFDKDGHPVCGVGDRGYWSNKSTFGETPFRQREDGTWYDPRTGKDCVVLSWNDMVKKTRKEPGEK